MDKSYRIHTNVISDTMLQVNMQQDFDFLEVLSLKLRQKDAYRLHSSNYGVIVGRVLANDAFGIPNAKVSVFIERDPNDPTDMAALYPYVQNTTKDKKGRRYNLLPDYSDDDCYRIVGTFPNKRLMLDDDVQLEVYDKYYKYTTVTNNAGDYMLFGVPAESVQIHVDIDLSDIGILSQKPRDFLYKGYNLTEFDSSTQFKESTNLDGLAQIFSQNKSVFVYPFWGDPDNGVACITRSDIQINYKFEPTCVFMGSIVSDNDGNAIGHRCAPDINSGMNDQLIGGSGTIEMIRKTTDGLVEEYQIQGNQLIDDDGVWCYQIPMNLDYIGTDEYGNVVPTDNPEKGIPTRTQVRFRISKTETGDEGFSRHTAKYLVPMNPIFSESTITPTIDMKGSDIEQMYTFGSATPEHCFRDLYWNNVYSVKNYIPKTQISTRAYSKNYNGLKGSNLAGNQNPIPFNKLYIDLPFGYIVMCILFTMVMYIVYFINKFFICLLNNTVLKVINTLADLKLPIIGRPFKFLRVGYIGCIVLSAGISEGNVAYFPGCSCSKGINASDCPEEMEGVCEKSDDTDELLDKIQRNLAQEYKIVKLDLYQDWVNGCLYMPLWYWRKRKKKSFLFGLFSSRAKNEYCDESRAVYKRLRTYVTCNIGYDDTNLTATNNGMPDSYKKWHKNKKARVNYRRGLIKPVENKDGLTAYYYTAVQATTENSNGTLDMASRTSGFKAVRLYATDIILLGNLDPNNLYGIPQLFTALPSTTANVPPIATIQEDTTITNEDNEKDSELNNEEESGTTITTGMDWNHNGGDMTPKYSTGLFMDLECTYVNTRPKSCINVERLSELGVNLDMGYDMSYRSGSVIKTGPIEADGFISKYELDDMENRAMFATMNHIGFIPQMYQDSISGYTTQVPDKNTNYLVPKFKYIYPVDFDGRLQEPMKLYKKGFQQAEFDEKDESYIAFRMGAENSGKTNNSEGRIRHFYIKDTNGYQMPLYNNSFYFYFGVKKGSTAIDKFNNMFYAPCYKNVKEPFSLVINTHGLSYCPGAYKNVKDGYAWIEVMSDDIRADYSYTLYDSFGVVVISESGMTAEKFVIGGCYDNDGNIIPNDNGAIKYQIKDLGKKCEEQEDLKNGASLITLTNGQYTIELTDNDGKKISKKITLAIPQISGNYTTSSLGTKFFNELTTPRTLICNEDNQFYGTIEMSGFTIDGYDCEIVSASYLGYNSSDQTHLYGITGRNDVFSSVEILLTLSVNDSEEDKTVTDCLCLKDGAPDCVVQDIDIVDGEETKKVNVIVWKIYQPNSYSITITQRCNSQNTENSTTDIVTVLNGESFSTTLNTMPTRFMIEGGNSRFYSSTSPASAETATTLTGWYGVHQEDSYTFDAPNHTTIEKNKMIWDDVLGGIDTNMVTAKTKRNILRFKFETMFALAHGVYVTKNSSKELLFKAKGGVSPILYRTVRPNYENDEKLKSNSNYIATDFWDSECNDYGANIVGVNYKDMSKDKKEVVPEPDGPKFNEIIFNKNTDLTGNYFAAFTKDGGYTSKQTIDTKIKIQKSPEGASVSPSGTIKIKGKDVEGGITTFKYAYSGTTNTKPYLRGMFVDRRLDYNFVIFAPAVGSYFDLHNFEAPDEITDGMDVNDKNKIWKGGRISGYTYNGIEMAYDEEYNIISASNSAITDENGEIIDVTASTEDNRLEYSYRYTDNKDENVKTTFNSLYNKNGVWGNWNNVLLGKFGYNEKFDGEDKPLIKQFYESYIDGMDIRHLYWSSFNSDRLSKYTTNGQLQGKGVNAITNVKNPFYVFNYPTKETSYYNGDFNREQVCKSNKGNYPTRRFIDIGALPQLPFINYEVSSCSYSIKPTINEDGTISAQTSEGEHVEVSLSFTNPVTFIKPENAKNDYANVKYVPSGTEGGNLKFVSDEMSIRFKYNTVSYDGFDTYTLNPRLIKVLPCINKIDGIGYIKTANPSNTSSGEFGCYGDGNSKLFDALKRVTIHTFNKSEKKRILWVVKDERDMELPSGVKKDGYDKFVLKNGVSLEEDKNNYGSEDSFFKKDDEFLTSDVDDFSNIVFYKTSKLKDKNASVVTILVRRELISQDNDNLMRRIALLETTDLIDCRYVKMNVVSGVKDIKDKDGNVTSNYGSFVTLMITSNETTQVTTPNVSIGDDGGLNVTNGTESVPNSTKLYIQTITFSMIFDSPADAEPENRENSTFTNYDMMTYNFRFKNKRGEWFDVEPSEIHNLENKNAAGETSGSTLLFVVKWSSDMGILSDNKDWNAKTDCQLFITTDSGFIYKLVDFKIKRDDGDDNKDKVTKEDQFYSTNVSIS